MLPGPGSYSWKATDATGRESRGGCRARPGSIEPVELAFRPYVPLRGKWKAPAGLVGTATSVDIFALDEGGRFSASVDVDRSTRTLSTDRVAPGPYKLTLKLDSRKSLPLVVEIPPEGLTDALLEFDFPPHPSTKSAERRTGTPFRRNSDDAGGTETRHPKGLVFSLGRPLTRKAPPCTPSSDPPSPPSRSRPRPSPKASSPSKATTASPSRGGSLESLCLPAETLNLTSELGSVTFDGSGGFTLSSDITTVCSNGAVDVENNVEDGLFTLFEDGRLLLDFNPSSPGVDVAELRLSFDHEVFVLGDNPDEPALVIGLRRRTDLSNTDLSGEYATARLARRWFGAGLETFSDFGDFVAAGAGVWAENGTKKILTASSASLSPYATNGTYSVAADGQLTIDGVGPVGQVGAGGSIAFTSQVTGTQTTLAVHARKPSVLANHPVDGEWWLSSGWAEPSISELGGSTASLDVDGSAGTFAILGLEVFVDPLFAGSSPLAVTGTFASALDGSLLAVGTGSSVSIDGWISEREDFGILVNRDDPAFTETFLLLGSCAQPVTYATGTPGTGGIVPEIVGNGSFPKVGSSTFGFQILSGVGAGAAFLAHATAPFPGLAAFGGMVWVDPTKVIQLDPFVLSGAPGSAGTGSAVDIVTLPSDPSSAGIDLYSQCLIADPGISGGFSMTSGIAWRICP